MEIQKNWALYKQDITLNDEWSTVQLQLLLQNCTHLFKEAEICL